MNSNSSFRDKNYILQVYLGSAGARDVEGKELPRLVYVSREKRPGYQHHKKAGAMNALVSHNGNFTHLSCARYSKCCRHLILFEL